MHDCCIMVKTTSEVGTLYKIGIVGASGYTGAELIRILHHHPKCTVAKIYSRSLAGQPVSDVFPGFFGMDLVFSDPTEDDFSGLDLLFLAVPAGAAGEYAKRFKGKVIDLGADFRFKDHEIYSKTYGKQHGAPELLQEATYGIPELFRDQIKANRIVGNPGCYPTSIILGLAPLIKTGYDGEIIASSLSGTSGAGKALSDAQHFAHRDENFGPYKVGCHRHTPEIEKALESLSGKPHKVVFVPHLVPAIRGITSTIYIDRVMSLNEAKQLYVEFYKDEFFVRVKDAGDVESKNVLHSNFVDIQVYEDLHADKLIIVSAIDNLIKGASGQAVQNMNLLFGLPEHTALDFYPAYP